MSPVVPGKALLSVQNIVRSYGAQPVLDNVSLTLHEGDRIGLIGRNGSGKSTLMRILAGVDTPDTGLVTRSKGLRSSILSQECSLDRNLTIGTVLEAAGADIRSMLALYHESMERLSSVPGDCWEHTELQNLCDELYHSLAISDGWHLEQEIKRISIALDLPDHSRVLGTLSGGELRRVDLSVRLIQRPDVLLLDEPTNHIDTRSVVWIEEFLERYQGSCVLVTHDRYFLDRVVNRIVELEFNGIFSFPGSYERFLEYKSIVEDTQIRSEMNRLALIRRELEWLKRGPKARTTKQKARIGRANDIIEQGPPQKHREFVFEIPEPTPLGKTILEARKVSHGFGETILFKDFSFLMQKEMRVGILGPNGSGKTTLLKVLMGLEEPKRGKIIIGDNTQFLYVDQAHEDVNPEKTILDFVSNGAKYWEIAKRRIYIPAYLEKFLFDKNSVNMPIGNLSGGEKNRLDMVRKLLRGGNFLVFDEPTNDLDLYTLRVLEETIDAFDGCALIVSHDRYFLNRVCTHMLIFEANSEIVQIAGNYDDYLLYVERRNEERARMERIVEKPVPVPKSMPSQRRITWKEKQELASMEVDILKAEERVTELEIIVQQPAFFERDHTEVRDTLQALEEAKDRVSSLYARWEELAALD